MTLRARGFAATIPADAVPWWQSEAAGAARNIAIPAAVALAVLVLLVLPLRRRILREPPILDGGQIAPVVERLPTPADQTIRIEAARTLAATDRQAATRALEVMVRT